MLHGRKILEKLSPRPGSIIVWSLTSANGIHSCLANNTISETGRSWTIICKFLPNPNILCVNITETPECS